MQKVPHDRDIEYLKDMPGPSYDPKHPGKELKRDGPAYSMAVKSHF